ncbi:pyridoxamine 5'-phosphate oxidase family protein [Streptomyces sp. NPDC050504]|uniref:pyridoxamine 5'-phosphate oxidase family protein n=1 Tax=Streptomyces sp. NPDC050504 TaxID=3365618 RepID=UPI0037A39447
MAKTENPGPAPRSLSDAELVRLVQRQQFGTLATVKRSGHPHLSTVVYTWDADARTLRISATADRLKVRQILREPRVALHIAGPDPWSFAVAEGEARIEELDGDVVGDGVGDGGPVKDGALLPDRRVWITIQVGRLYGTALAVPGAVAP